MARRRGRTSLAAIVSSVRAVEPLPVAVVATAPADGGGVEWSGVGGEWSAEAWHGVLCCAVVVEVVRIFVSHSNLYQSCVRNDG